MKGGLKRASQLSPHPGLLLGLVDLVREAALQRGTRPAAPTERHSFEKKGDRWVEKGH